MKGAKLYIILGIIIAGIIALSIAGKKGLLGNKKGTKVAIDTIKNRSIVESVSSSGKIFPVKEIKVSPQTSGTVKQLLVHEGQYVRKGDVIAKVEQSASASPISLEGLLPMQGGGMPTAPANNKPKNVNIYAPSSGIITRLNIHEGESLMGAAQMGGAEMLIISDMSKMKVDVEIGENDIQKIAIGDTAIIEVDAYQRKKFRGFVSKIAQSNTSNSIMANAMSSDQVSNYTVSVEISQDTYQDIINKNTKFPFRPGMSAQVEILTEHHNNVIAVPIVAVTARDLDSLDMDEPTDEPMKEYVFVLGNDKKIKLQEVTTGAQDNTFIEVLSGIKIGDQVVSAPYSAITLKLKDKDLVQVVPKKELFEKEKN